MLAPDQNVGANPAAGGSQNGGLPPGHPTIELPTEARSFVDKIERDAIAKPKDVTAWNKFGAVSMRAAMFDQTYYGKAEEAYGHVLKLEPDNLDALRGIGDIDYDKQHYDEAIAAYEHYLKKKPDDPEVRTDLGTMYLYTGNADQAVVQYKKAVASQARIFPGVLQHGNRICADEQAGRRGGDAEQGAHARAGRHCARSSEDADRETQRRAGAGPSASMQAASAATPAAKIATHGRRQRDSGEESGGGEARRRRLPRRQRRWRRKHRRRRRRRHRRAKTIFMMRSKRWCAACR